jgi:hypothetical protein
MKTKDWTKTPTGRPSKAFLDSLDTNCIYFYRDSTEYEEYNLTGSGHDRCCDNPALIKEIDKDSLEETILSELKILMHKMNSDKNQNSNENKD